MKNYVINIPLKRVFFLKKLYQRIMFFFGTKYEIALLL